MSEIENIEYTTLGAGCFWGVESLFSKKEGILSTISGYTGGESTNPTYEDICTGKTGHAEVVQLGFNPAIISFEEVLSFFFRLHDPTTLNAQGYDIGTQYRSVIYFHSEKQEELARKKVKELDLSGKFENKIVTEITQIKNFYKAEEYHQDYYDKKYEGRTGPICHYLRDE